MSVEEVRDDGLVSKQMSVPRVERGLVLRETLLLVHVDVGFLPLTVEVLSEQVQDSVDALVRVVLAVPLELGRILPENLFEHVRGND